MTVRWFHKFLEMLLFEYRLLHMGIGKIQKIQTQKIQKIQTDENWAVCMKIGQSGHS